MFTFVDSKSDSYRLHKNFEGLTLSFRDMYPNVAEMYDSKIYDNEKQEVVSLLDASFGMLQNELAKVITEPFGPITEFTYQEDVNIVTGGGLVDFIEYYEVDYQGIMKSSKNIFANKGNDIPTINASIDQKYGNVFTYEIAYDLHMVDLEKLSKTRLGRMLTSLYQEGIRLGWEAMCQEVAYFGVPNGKVKGLFNSDKAYSMSGTFDTSSIQTIIASFNAIEEARFEATANISTAYDTYLLPTDLYTLLVNTTTDLLNTNLLEYLQTRSLAATRLGRPIKIAPRVQLNDASTHGRIVAYRNEQRFVRLEVPYMLQAFATLPNATTLAYRTFFVGQVAELLMPYAVDATTVGSIAYFDLSSAISA